LANKEGCENLFPWRSLRATQNPLLIPWISFVSLLKQVVELHQTMPRNYFLAQGLLAGQETLPQSCMSAHCKSHESGSSDKAEEGSASFLVGMPT